MVLVVSNRRRSHRLDLVGGFCLEVVFNLKKFRKLNFVLF